MSQSRPVNPDPLYFHPSRDLNLKNRKPPTHPAMSSNSLFRKPVPPTRSTAHDETITPASKP